MPLPIKIVLEYIPLLLFARFNTALIASYTNIKGSEGEYPRGLVILGSLATYQYY